MALTYEPIATNTLSSATNSVSFTSIPSTYTDLVLVVSAWHATASSQVALRFNSDSGGNYSYTRLLGSGTAATSERDVNKSTIFLGYINSTATSPNFICSIQDYSNSTTYKTTFNRFNTIGNWGNMGATVGNWRSTAAITSMAITPADGGNFASGSIFTLFGIQAA